MVLSTSPLHDMYRSLPIARKLGLLPRLYKMLYKITYCFLNVQKGSLFRLIL